MQYRFHRRQRQQTLYDADAECSTRCISRIELEKHVHFSESQYLAEASVYAYEKLGRHQSA